MANGRLAMPILTYPGAGLVGASVRDLVSDADAQHRAQVALHERYRTQIVMTCMDLSVEAEAFGARIAVSAQEVPTVVGRFLSGAAELEGLRVPKPGEGRTGVYLEVVRRLRQLPDRPWVLAGMLGPFSLAARLFGVGETLELTAQDPDLTHRLVALSAGFLAEYAAAFKAAGAHGVIIAEPTAGLLSPRGLAAFSAAYVRKIVAATDDDRFAVILHNCAAKLVHLAAALESGAGVYHFGAPMDLPAALGRVPAGVVLCGNLNPSSVFVQSSPDEVRAATLRLREAAAAFPAFVISSGCDVPPQTPLANVNAFFEAVRT